MLILSEIITVAIVVLAVVFLVFKLIKRIKTPFSCCVEVDTKEKRAATDFCSSSCASCPNSKKCNTS